MRHPRIARNTDRLAPCAALAGLACLSAHATTWIRPTELPTLVDEAVRAVQVKVVDVRYGFDQRRLHSTWVRAEVERTLFDRASTASGAASTLELKIYGAPVTLADGSRLFVDGTARLEPGERYILLLTEESPWGFRNTPGLSQGAFHLIEGPGGREMVESLAGNATVLGREGLARWIDPATVDPAWRAWLEATRGPIPAEVLRHAIVELGERGGPR